MEQKAANLNEANELSPSELEQVHGGGFGDRTRNFITSRGATGLRVIGSEEPEDD